MSECVKEKTAQQAKAVLVDWMKLIRSEERYYFPKAMRLFYQMPFAYQKGFVQFFAEKHEMPKWLDKVDDNTQYPDVIRSILFYYSGRKELEQPFKHQLLPCLLEFTKSDEFKKAGEMSSAAMFTEELDSL